MQDGITWKQDGFAGKQDGFAGKQGGIAWNRVGIAWISVGIAPMQVVIDKVRVFLMEEVHGKPDNAIVSEKHETEIPEFDLFLCPYKIKPLALLK